MHTPHTTLLSTLDDNIKLINKQINELEVEWDKLDSSGVNFQRQLEVSNQIELLNIDLNKFNQSRNELLALG